MGLEYADLEKLPGDVKVELPDGTSITLEDLRKAAVDHVNKRISDLTPREQKLVTREQALAEAEQRVRDTMAALANTPPNTNTGNTPDPNAPATAPLGYTKQQWDAILADPFSRPLVTTLAALAERSERLEKQVLDMSKTTAEKEEAARQLAETQWINHQLEGLAASNAAYKDPAERAKLLEYAKEILQRRDLTAIHRARNYDTAVKDAEETGYQRGLKEGQSKAPVPSIPHGTRVVPVQQPPEKLPATFNEFADAAANDQALIQEIREAASSPVPPQ